MISLHFIHLGNTSADCIEQVCFRELQVVDVAKVCFRELQVVDLRGALLDKEYVSLKIAATPRPPILSLRAVASSL